jgi:L-2-hydroxyglutarate oxidase
MSSKSFDVAVIGGGIVGLATARELARGNSVAVLEAEPELAAHQTGHNSGVIHSGLYYKPGSLKAKNCAEGRSEMYRFCQEREIPHDNCGKIVVATSEEEIPRLDELERRGKANGLTGIERLDGDGLREHEPHVAGIAGLLVPETGIVDFTAVANAMGDDVRESGGEVRKNARVTGVERRSPGFVLSTPAGEFEAKTLINCGGLQCDRVARMCGLHPQIRIVPFRGEYYKLKESAEHLVRNLIYPVPDPRFPFLGVHFTRIIEGGIEAGPNAVLALRREGYGRFSFSAGDTLSSLTYPGFWRMASKFWRTAAGEVQRSFSTAAFVKALNKLMPELTVDDVQRHGSGIRAQALTPNGALLDDFHILGGEGMLHVLNAPSPAATASIAIGRALAGRWAKV